MAKYKGAFPQLPERGWFAKGDEGAEVEKLQRLLNWANDGTIVPKLVVDGKLGTLTENAVAFYEEVHQMSIDKQFGSKCLASTKWLDMSGVWRAMNWAWSVAKDNSFTYGTGQRAHRSGCYFCQTNTGPRKKNKERKGEPHVVKDSQGNGHTYERTYCCNTFVTAAYAHGAKDPKTLAVCKAGSCFGMSPKDWEKSPNFKRVGKAKSVPFDKLERGDVIMADSDKYCHVWMYLGFDRFVEAADEGWGAGTIAVKTGAKRRYNAYAKDNTCYVVRYRK